ncbi:MAG: ABC transporter permease [Gammaproteobacteria bacterium]|nr:ABC transporter permease [Gammaproteobacteria bacterium]
MTDTSRQSARIERSRDASTLRLTGAWTTRALAGLEPQLAAVERGPTVVDATGLDAFDTGGALALRRLLEVLRAGATEVKVRGLRQEYRELLALVEERLADFVCPLPGPPPGHLERIGRGTVELLEEMRAFFAFIGQVGLALLHTLAHPGRLRWREIVADIHAAGVNALPIIGLLSFLIGIVIAYQGGIQLRTYGANIYVVELVALTMVRELAPVMAAVIVAGRTGSAYTAQIGTMQVNEEVDALRTLGIPPLEMLVLPKLLGLVVTLPLLTMFADVLGVFGGMVMAASILDVSFQQFFERIPEVLDARHFMIGIGKAPVFALLIASVGCFQGFRVANNTDSIGRQTTVSVVQGIFLVIVVDAAFSILFSAMGV